MIKIFIAAATPVTRAGLRAMLSGPTVQVVGESATLTELAASWDAADVLVVGDEDLLRNFRGGDGIRPLGVLALSNDRRLATILSSLTLSGWGLVPADAPVTQLQSALEAVAQGQVVLSPALATELLQQNPSADQTDFTLDEPLTSREQEILELLSQGLPNKLIARQLGISEHTVKFHVSSLYVKLGASGRAEAVSQGARLGLITF